MAKPDEILDRIIDGGMYLVMWGGAILAALFVFVFVSGLVWAISGSLGVGALIGLIVTFGIGWVLYQVGKRVF